MTVQLENSIPKPILFKILNQDLDKAYEKYGIALYAMAYTGLCMSMPMIMGLLSTQLDNGESASTIIYKLGILLDIDAMDAQHAMLIALALSYMEDTGQRYKSNI
jgi:hypothetical protein